MRLKGQKETVHGHFLGDVRQVLGFRRDLVVDLPGGGQPLGQPDEERRAFAEFAVEADLAIVGLNNLLGNGHAQAASLSRHAISII